MNTQKLCLHLILFLLPALLLLLLGAPARTDPPPARSADDFIGFGPGTLPLDAVAQIKKSLAFVDMVEGPNEVDVFASSAAYQGHVFPQGPATYQTDLYAALKADPLTRAVGVVALSTATGTPQTFFPQTFFPIPSQV